MRTPISSQEKEYRVSLLRTERRAIIPLKWLVSVASISLWLSQVSANDGQSPHAFWLWRALDLTPFALSSTFALYALFNFIETFYLWSESEPIATIRPLALVSYLTDIVYVTILIYYTLGQHFWDQQAYSDFYILYFLLAMRGFALFSTIGETILVNALISALFILMLWLQQRSFGFLADGALLIRLILIWLVLLMGWFIMVVLNQQKMDLIRVHERLMRTENLIRMGELAAGVAHEINNPLGIIIANAEYMKRMCEPGDPRLEDIEAIQRESNRCKEIVQQLLAYANPKPGEIQPIDAGAINDEVLQFVFPRGRTGKIELVKEAASASATVYADPNLLKQALLNIYVNAKQAIPEGKPGRIVSRIYTKKFPAKAVIEVEDNGQGIPEEDWEHVFDPFFTRKPQGTGLGLAMTQRIIESFDGTVALEPVSPHGVLVRMELPEARRA